MFLALWQLEDIMELELWQYIIMVVVAIILLSAIIKYAKGFLSKLLYSALWIAINIFLFTVFFKIV